MMEVIVCVVHLWIMQLLYGTLVGILDRLLISLLIHKVNEVVISIKGCLLFEVHLSGIRL